jgi:hypothetical protein
MTELQLCIVHIPKCGGTTIGRWVAAVLKRRYVRLVREPETQPLPIEKYWLVRDRYFYARSLDSHSLRAVSQELWPRARFAIVLREPVEWILSYYYFRRYLVEQRLVDLSLEERRRWMDANFPSVADMLPQLANYVTRFLAWSDLTSPMDDDAPRRARDELLRYHHVLTMDRLADAPRVLVTTLPELSGTALPYENVNPNRKSDERWADRESAGTIAKIRAAVRCDLELYDLAVDIAASRTLPRGR